MIVSLPETTEELQDRIKRVSIMSSVLRRKALNLMDRLETGDCAYNPYSKRSLGKLTRELEDIQRLTSDIGLIGETL